MAGDNDKNKKGFSGLSDLASEVSDINEPIKPEPKTEAKPSTPKQSPQPQCDTSTSEPEQKSTSSPPPVETVNTGNNEGGSGGKWILGIISVIFVIWLINNVEQSNKKPSYTQPSSSQSYGSSKSTPAPVTQTQSNTQSAGLQYTKPSVGSNNVLSVPEIRWCIREGIRIEAMRDIIDNNTGIDEFNQIVNDYNSRCGIYRYREGSQSRAERDVEAYRTQIVSEAIREAKQLGRSYQPSYPSVSPGVSSSTAPKKPNAQYTREAQQLLTDLGYDPGPVDGDYGRRTADAVRAFQKAQGIVVDGWVSESLIETLQSAIINKSKKHKAPTDLQRNIPGINKDFDTSKNISDISDADRAGIIEACKYRGSPANVYSCQQEELRKLKQTGPGPDLSGLSSSDRAGIIEACKYRGSPANVYSCQQEELSKLKRTGPGPDLSGLSFSERAGIIEACKYRGSPANVYSCQKEELNKLRTSRY
ncbi:peptidoglycan-binding protein [Proteus mirabilis]|nr:peptidoglycan-binding protein [Proteus mirabilis]